MMPELLTRIRYFFRNSSAAELEEELRAHVAEAIDNKIAGGMSHAEARRHASLEFGSMEAAREQTHTQHPRAAFDILRQDVRFGLRSLRRDRSFTLVAVFILALGIGANIAVFSLVNTILLRPLPFRDAEQLVWLQPKTAGGGLSGSTYSSDAFDDLRDMNRSYSGVTGYFAFSGPNNMKLTGNGVAQPLTGVGVLPNFLDVLGVTPALGRNFRAEDGRKNAAPVVILSHAFWKAHFRGNTSVIGTSASIDERPTLIAGVLPSSFDFGSVFSPGTRVDMITPFSLDEGRTWGNIITFIGRMKPGITAQMATNEAATLFPRFYWGKREPSSKGSYEAAVAVPMKEHVAGQLRRSLTVLWAAVGTILMIVCVNLSNLLLSRAAARSKEFSLRFALGATRTRLVRQLLTESVLLSLAGTLTGVMLAAVVIRWLAHQGSIALPLMSELQLDAASLLWTVLLAIVATLLFGVAPSLRMTRDNNLQTTLKDGGAGTGLSRHHDRLRNVLVISEVALACVLLVGAGLLLRSFLHVLEIDLGFQPTHAYTITAEMPYKLDYEHRSVYYRNLLHEVSSLPGIQGAGITDNLPLGRNRTWGAPGIKGVQYGKNERLPTFVYIVTPDYLPTMGMKLRGRDISWNDAKTTEKVMVMNERAAKALFPSGDAVDHVVQFQGGDVRVVGVVPDIHETDVEAASAWQVYLPVAQGWGENGVELVVRSSLPSATLAPSLLNVLRRVNPAQANMQLRPLQEFVDHSTSPRRFFAILVTVFAGTGLLLACLGIYGVISYGVTRRTQEIGIRMALGASRGSVQRDVVLRTLQLAGVGVAVGTIASVLAARAIGSMLYGTQPTDPITFAAMLALLIGVALAAGYVPARRASHVSSMDALRTQ